MQAVQFMRPAKIDLPPRAILLLRMKAPLAVLDAVARAGCILLGRDSGLGRSQLVLNRPIGFDLLPGDYR
jgi:hypothetical protein